MVAIDVNFRRAARMMKIERSEKCASFAKVEIFELIYIYILYIYIFIYILYIYIFIYILYIYIFIYMILML